MRNECNDALVKTDAVRQLVPYQNEVNNRPYPMNKPQNTKWPFPASLALAGSLLLATSALAQVTVTTANQTGSANTWPFTPTGSAWVVDQADSLINGLVPTAAPGNWGLEGAGRNVNSLTVNTNLTIGLVNPGNTTSLNYVTYGNGSGAGSQLIYTLPANANGYNVTNISVYGGWANSGRDQQAYVVLYSTVANPTSFSFLAYVNSNPSIPGNTPDAVKAVINNASGGAVANNVYALKFVLNFPGVENGYCGIAAITVGGTAASSVVSPALAVTTANQSGSNPFTPTWTAETPDLILGLTPTTANGTFTKESAGGIPVLTDGSIGSSGSIGGFATCGASGGTSLIFSLTNNLVNGEDITNIVTYSGWGDGGRDGQYYTVSYSTVAAPNTFVPITTVYYLPSVSGAPANRVGIAMNDGSALAHGVANIKFDFASPPASGNFNNAYQGYSEIVVQGHDTMAPPPPPSALLVQDILPASVVTFIGDQVVFSATYSNFPPVAPQWQQITTGAVATNVIATGVVNVTNNDTVTSTLTLNNVQPTSAGIYRLAGLNATNGAAAISYSTAAPLTINSLPAPVNNVIIAASGQLGLGAPSPVNASTNFYPTWVENTNTDLILGSVDGGPGVPGTVAAGAGNYNPLGSACNGDPVIMSDGSPGYQNYYPNVGGNQTLDALGNDAGLSLTYTLPVSANGNGWSLTNITVFGGWGDGGRDEQKYQVLYSTVAAPTVFNDLVSVDYLPAGVPANTPSATRTVLTPASGAMAQNVYAIQFNFFNAGSRPENGWEGYSEIVVAGYNSPFVPVLLTNIAPTAAEDVVGSSVVLTASFSGATSYQWLKNGTNLPEATSPTLTLTNLKLSDAATNGGYKLVAYNSAGSNVTASATLYVDPVPAPVGNVITAVAYQASAAGGFTPTWDTSNLGNSLIYGQNPPGDSYDTIGDFSDPDITPTALNQAGGLTALTDGGYGPFDNSGPHPAFATAGPGGPAPRAGNYVSYTLGANANGYDVTNIQISGGWNDNGRDSQYYTVLYSTVANPTIYLPLAVVANNLSTGNNLGGGNGKAVSSGSGIQTTVRTTFTPATGVLASNVYAIYVDFQFPEGVPNGYSGYSEISVFGSPSASAPPAGPLITATHEETSNTWTPETPNLIAGQLPSSQGPGVFTGEGCNVTNMTDGVLGFGNTYSTALGADTNSSVSWITFSSTNGAAWNLTNIVVYTLWHDFGRDGQFYKLSYSTEAAPTTFLPLANVAYNPFVPHDGRASGNRVQISPAPGQTLLAANVAAVKFDFTSQGSQDYGWSGYTQIILQGDQLAPPTLPTLAPVVVSGGNLQLSGSGGTPGTHYTWLISTNLQAPLGSWTVSAAGFLDGNGAFSTAIPVNATNPPTFFRLQLP